MSDITKIPYTELIKDKYESLADIDVCTTALEIGVTTYSNGRSTQKRLSVNRGIVDMIDAELARRKQVDTKR